MPQSHKTHTANRVNNLSAKQKAKHIHTVALNIVLLFLGILVFISAIWAVVIVVRLLIGG